MKDDERNAGDRHGGKLLRFRNRRTRESSEPSCYDAVFAAASAHFAAHQNRLDRERLAADRLIERLVEQPFERRSLLIENSRHFQTWGLAERLIQEGQRCVGEFEGLSRLDLVRTALTITEKLNPGIYGRYRHHDLRATARAHLGNALRVAGLYDSAADAFAASHRQLDRGTGGAIERAQVESFEVSLLNALSRFAAAGALADRALARLPKAGDLLQIELLHKRAVAERDPELAIAGFEQVLDKISLDEQPFLAFVALQGLSMKLADVGRLDEGHDTVTRAGRLVHHAKRWGLIYLEWSAAILAARGGETTTAIGILSGIWLTFSRRPVNDAFLLRASLELVNAQAASEDPDRAPRLAEQIGDQLILRNYPPAALEAWAEVRRWIARGRIPRPFQEDLDDYLCRSWTDPGAQLILRA